MASPTRLLNIAFLAAAGGALTFLVAGCDWEVSKLPLPRPSPTPTPSPSPATASAAVDLPFAPAAVAPLSAQVARAHADLLTAASATAVQEASKFESVAKRAASAPVSASKDLAKAMDSLSVAKHSYQRTEAAVFYVDPDATEELVAQPDPLRAGSAGPATDAFAEINRRLEKLAELTAEELDNESLRAVLDTLPEVAGWSARLRADMEAMAKAWDPDAPESFREKYFLASPDLAVARIFQGLLAQSGDVLPERWLQGEIVPAEVTGRTDALRELYLGITERRPEGKGLHDLVYDSAPAQAMVTYAAIAQASALADALAIDPTNAETRRQLLAALGNVTRQLELSAGAVGIRIVENPVVP